LKDIIQKNLTEAMETERIISLWGPKNPKKQAQEAFGTHLFNQNWNVPFAFLHLMLMMKS